MGAYAKRNQNSIETGRESRWEINSGFPVLGDVILDNWVRNHIFVVHFSSSLGQAVNKLGEKIFMGSALPV